MRASRLSTAPQLLRGALLAPTAVAACLLMPACASRSLAPTVPAAAGVLLSSLAGGPMQPGARSFGSAKIQHIVVVVQENRSFDDLFYGFPGANTATSGLNSKGQTIALQPIPLEAPWNIDHLAKTFFLACDGHPRGQNCKMDGFNREKTYGSGIPPNLMYAYVPHAETKPLFDIARQYVLADNTFTSNIDDSFESHQYFIAAQSNQAVNTPNGNWGCGQASATVLTLKKNRTYGPLESPCFDSQTIGDELDAKKLPWRYYASGMGDLGYIWSAYQAISHVYNGTEWKTNVKTPPSAFLTEVQKGHLAAVTWITPTCATSDHPQCHANQGPDWVASVVNAVGESSFWDSTAVFIMWDDWGGWYDHVPPPYADYDGLGIRVPMMVVSAYAKKAFVSHVQYEHGSILRFIEDTFGLGQLAASDARATSPAADCFDFNRPPRTFKPIKTTLGAPDFIGAPNDPRIPDEE